MPPKNEPGANQPAGTDGSTDPAANQPNGSAAATPETPVVPDGHRLISDKDYKNLISQRDKGNNAAQEAAAAADENGTILNALLQKDAVRDAVAKQEFKKNYPDVTESELLEANPTSDEQIEAFAKAKQARYEEVKQAHLKKVQVATAPAISPSEKAQKLKDLGGTNKPANAFQQALQLTRMKTTE